MLDSTQAVAASEAELTDGQLAVANGGCGGGCYGGGGAFYGGGFYGGPVYGGVLYGGPGYYGGPAYGGVLYGGPGYGISSGCPQVIVVQQPAPNIAPPPPVSIPPQLGTAGA